MKLRIQRPVLFRNSILLLGVICFCSFTKSLIAEEKHYVTCRFWGELGNQMFEAANAVAFALDHGYEPVFWGFNRIANGPLNLQYVFHRLNVIPDNHNISFENCLQIGALYNYAPLPDPQGKNIQLLGHFVNEKYFVHHRDYIVKLFAPSEKILTYIYDHFGNLLKKGPTVAVHVRTFIRDNRDPKIQGFAGASWDYFIQAMSHFPSNVTFLVFSDNPKWTKQNFPIKSPNIHFIEGNPHYIDFYFMSLCDHQIISPDSTYSWWAAWLNRNPQKIVIAPHFWYTGYTGEDAFPPEWIRVYAKPI